MVQGTGRCLKLTWHNQGHNTTVLVAGWLLPSLSYNSSRIICSYHFTIQKVSCTASSTSSYSPHACVDFPFLDTSYGNTCSCITYLKNLLLQSTHSSFIQECSTLLLSLITSPIKSLSFSLLFWSVLHCRMIYCNMALAPLQSFFFRRIRNLLDTKNSYLYSYS